ncbi:MAG TPA: TonB family protein [Terriglobales bacterium]|nr:TonB family protein [Terriglobales bacterium]
MSYKALLFCPDEASARLVTQVLSELDFTVELSFEPFLTVKKLGEETYDAVVVDCANEQNATVLFKGARSSTLNHSSLCVAVAEGQVGLANAFRIGANLVLTKPINIEQSKNTLRVARGLLRKNSPQSAGESKPTSTSGPSAHTAPAPNVPAVPAMAAPVAAPSMPSSLLEAEQKRSQPASGSAATSSPGFASPPRPAASTPSFGGGHSTGFAAAPALAPERTEQVPAESKTFREMPTASPLVTQDPIVAEPTFHERRQPAAPTFSSYAYRPAAKSGVNKAIWIVPLLLIVGASGYFGWKKYQPMRYIRTRSVANNTATVAAPAQSVAAEAKPSPAVDVTAEEPSTVSGASTSANSTPVEATYSSTPVPTGTAGAAEGFPTKEHIDISQPAAAPEKPATVVAKSQPFQVSRKTQTAPVEEEQPAPAPAPPVLVITGNNPADETIAGLVATNVPVPRAAPSTLRISQGITQGLLIKRVPPVYPSAAIQLRREGTVEVIATISKTGAISKVKVLSGDATLAKAAVEAVKQWKYRPYLLNGEPVEIETQVSLIFRLPH